jgi:competence protein ComEC
MDGWPALRVAAWVYAGYLLSWCGRGVGIALRSASVSIGASLAAVSCDWWLGPMLALLAASAGLCLRRGVGRRLIPPLPRFGRHEISNLWAPLLALTAGLIHSPAWSSGPAVPPDPAERRVCVWITAGGGERAEGIDAHSGLRLRLRASAGLQLPATGSLLTVIGKYRPPGRMRYLERGLHPSGAAARVAARRRPGSLRVRSMEALCPRVHAPPQALRARAWVAAAVASSHDRTGLFRALLLADRSALDPLFTEEMRAAGLAHILALSGLHIGFVAMVIVTLTSRFPRAVGASIVAIALASLPMIVGASPSVLRASTAGIVWALGRASGRRVAAFNALGAGALAIWLLDSAAPCEAGFQLSFAATAAILLAAHPVRSVGLWQRIRGWLWQGIWIGLAAQLGTLGLVGHHFGRLPLWAPLSGLLAVPLAAALLASLLCGLPVAYLSGGGLGSGVERAGGWASWGIAAVAHYTARLPAALLPMPPISMQAALLLTVIGLYLVAALARGKRYQAAAALLSIGLVLGAPLWRFGVASQRCTLMVADVGQGLSVWVRWPDRHTLLFDTGPPAFRGEPLLARSLACTGTLGGPAELTTAVVSHAHADHDGAIPWMMNQAPPEVVLYPIGTHPSWRTEQALADHAASDARGLPLGGICRGRHWTALRAATASWVSTNDSSIALLAALGEQRILIPGDLEIAGEAALLTAAEALAGESLRSDVLLLGHHGSRTSSSAAFLDAVQPRIAIASAGLQNSFGHPHAETIAALRERGIPLLRTDRDGTILIETDGSRWWCATASGRGWSGRLRDLPQRVRRRP